MENPRSPANRVAAALDPEPWRLSAVSLVVANAIPLVGVLGFDWSVFSVILLYWFENVIVGGFNVLRILFCRPADPVTWVGKPFVIPFFIIHYGMFTTAHGFFVLALFGGASGRGGFDAAELFAAMQRENLTAAGAALVVSHGISFWRNYLVGGEYRRVGPFELMLRPYGRIMILHVTTLIGGFLVQILHSPMPALVLLILLKTGVDLAAHLKERTKLGPPAGPVRLETAGQGAAASIQPPPSAL